MWLCLVRIGLEVGWLWVGGWGLAVGPLVGLGWVGAQVGLGLVGCRCCVLFWGLGWETFALAVMDCRKGMAAIGALLHQALSGQVYLLLSQNPRHMYKKWKGTQLPGVQVEAWFACYSLASRARGHGQDRF